MLRIRKANYGHPRYQKQGIGRKLLEYISEKYKTKVSWVEISTLKKGLLLVFI